MIPRSHVTPSSGPGPSCWQCCWCCLCCCTSGISETCSSPLIMIKNIYLDTNINLLWCLGAELHLEVDPDHVFGIGFGVGVHLQVLKPVAINPALPKTYTWIPRSTFYARELIYTLKWPWTILLVYQSSGASPTFLHALKNDFIDEFLQCTSRPIIIISKKDHFVILSSWNKNVSTNWYSVSVCHSSLTSNTVHCYSLANGRQIVYEDRTRVPVVDEIHKDTFIVFCTIFSMRRRSNGEVLVSDFVEVGDFWCHIVLLITLLVWL